MPTITTITTMRRSLSRSRSFRAKEKSSNSILISRLSHTHCLLKLLIQVLDEMSRIELQVSKSYNTLSKTDSCPDFKSESHFHSVFTDLFLSFQKTSRHHSTVSEALSSIIVNLTSLKRKLKTLIKTVSDSNTLRVKQRRQDDELVSNSKRALVNSLSSIGNSLTSDPWMLHFKLKSATNISSENFKKRSIECKSEFESIKQLEDEIFNGVKSILAGLKNLDLKGALFNHVVETINRIDTKKEWDLFIRDHPNILEFEVEPDYSLDDLLKNQTLNLVKSGVISVPKPLLPGWKEAHFILTKSGWLHQFESKIDPSKSAPSPIRSLNLASKSLSPVIEDDSEKQNEFLLVDYPVRSIKDYLNGDKFRFDTEVDDWVNSISKFTRVNSSAASIKSATSASSRKFSLFRSNSFVASRKSIESVRSNTTANSRKASWWGGKVEDVELEPKPKKMDKGKEKVKFTPSTVGGSVITEVVDTTEVLQVEKPKKKMFSFLKRGNLSPSFPVA